MAKTTTTQTTGTPATPYSVELPKGKDCKGSVRFETQDINAHITNVYVSRNLPGISNARAVRVTIEVLQ